MSATTLNGENQSSGYVKVCPKCGVSSSEGLNTCPGCGFFLGLVRAVPRPQEGPPAPGSEPEPPGPSPEAESREKEEPRLFLESVATGASYEVRSGQTVGQAHPTSRAQVQMSGIPNINFVSREHCRFDFEDGAWFVTALPSALNGASINQVPLAPGGRVRVRSGDELLLANVPFRVGTAAP
ncbi:MAG: FHA domain-containing protein [Thermodesulfobacteriota bacterium]